MPLDGPFHEGELAAQALAGAVSHGGGIRNFMPDQHRVFFNRLPWLFAGVLDSSGWPLATALTGSPGFATSADANTLWIDALPDQADPAASAFSPGQPIGLLGLELESRRRNRANGRIATVGTTGFTVAVAQSFGNCAKYIQVRERRPDSVEQPAKMEELSGLDEAARSLIAGADTFFIASAVDTQQQHGGVDVSHRGGRPGFVRIDGDVLTVPDFAGNNYFNTLGNLMQEPRAGLLFINFATGTTLQLQGTVEIVWKGPELAALDGAERLWRFRVARGWRRTNALPLRWSGPDYAPTTLHTGIWSARVAA